MKKNLFLVASLVFSGVSFSQITIVSTDLPGVGDVVTTAVDTMPSISIGSAGASQTWDFSSLDNNFQSSMSFVAPSSTPYASDFPSATLAFEESAGSGIYAYLLKNTNELSILGIEGDFLGTGVMKLPMVPKNKMLEFPMTYGNTFTDAHTETIVLAGSTLGVPVDSVKIENTVNKTVTVDAFGSLTTPTSVYNSLRQKNVSITESQISALALGIWSPIAPASVDTSTEYTWWAIDNSIAYSVADVSLDSVGNVMSASFLVANPPVSVSETKPELKTLNIYPNPSTTYFEVSSAEPVRVVKVVDMNGKVVLTASKTRVDVSTLPVASYIVRVEGLSGQVQYLPLQIVR